MLDLIPGNIKLSLGIVDGRNIWKNDFEDSLKLINKALEKIGEERVMIAPSCSLLHVPCNLDLETNEKALPPEIKQWLSFARQKLDETAVLKLLSMGDESQAPKQVFNQNQAAIQSRKTSTLIHNKKVGERINTIGQLKGLKRPPFQQRKKEQQKHLNLPPFPSTTIGSFPQTAEVRTWRAKRKKGELSTEEYNRLIRSEIEKTIAWQEKLA